jgi:SAM-dependent methyltransferase
MSVPEVVGRASMPTGRVVRRESALGALYRNTYDLLCGTHPRVYPWHFQWLAGFYLLRSLRTLLPTLSGRVLDAGCGAKPYRDLVSNATEYTGLDVEPGPSVDIVVAADQRWPLPDQHFDVLLSSQVLEHVEKLELTVAEIRRVVKPGGLVVLSFPFMYNEHGAPYDFRRFSAYGATRIFPDFEAVTLERQGGIGSTLGILFLNWIDESLNTTTVTRILKAILLPVWILLCAVVNLIGWLVDRLDTTKAFYNNVLVVLRKPLAGSLGGDAR